MAPVKSKARRVRKGGDSGKNSANNYLRFLKALGYRGSRGRELLRSMRLGCETSHEGCDLDNNLSKSVEIERVTEKFFDENRLTANCLAFCTTKGYEYKRGKGCEQCRRASGGGVAYHKQLEFKEIP
jgi:hypothetical protein